MHILSPIIEKNPRKYRIVTRSEQAKILDGSKGQSQRATAKIHKISRTSLQHWMYRKNKLKKDTDSKVVEFFESSEGQEWLHVLTVAILLIFHLNGNIGTAAISKFFEMTGISKFVGTSNSSLKRMAGKISKLITVFGKEETERLSQKMGHKNITGALDENFIMDRMTLILMDPVSGYILAEQTEDKRDAETWDRVTRAAVKGLKVTIHQLVGDEAGGLTKLATDFLNVKKGPDLFHVQQDITKGLTSHLGRALHQLSKENENLQKERQEEMLKFRDHLNDVGDVQELSKKGVSAGKRVVEIERKEKVNRDKIEVAERQHRSAKEARREITRSYHPFSLDTGERQNPETVKAKIEKSYATLEEISEEVGCTDKQEKKLEKAKGMLGSMIDVLTFFFSFLIMTIKSMELDESSGKLFEKLVSLEYLKLCLQKTKNKKEKEIIKTSISRLKEEFSKDVLWAQLDLDMQVLWIKNATECAHVFQRSSSCVEGRNGQLSLKFHAARRLNKETLAVLTILHNFFIRRADGTTAAERFFGQKPQDLFTWLLDKVELPRPRERCKKDVKEISEKLVA